MNTNLAAVLNILLENLAAWSGADLFSERSLLWEYLPHIKSPCGLYELGELAVSVLDEVERQEYAREGAFLPPGPARAAFTYDEESKTVSYETASGRLRFVWTEAGEPALCVLCPEGLVAKAMAVPFGFGGEEPVVLFHANEDLLLDGSKDRYDAVAHVVKAATCAHPIPPWE